MEAVAADQKSVEKVRALYPDAFKDGRSYDAPYDYEPLLRSFGRIVLFVEEGDYQGDSWVLYRGDTYDYDSVHGSSEIGYLQFGWGSCSGCDALQGARNFEELARLYDSLRDSVKWFENRAAAREWFAEHDFEGDYAWHIDEFKRFHAAATALLSDS